MYKNKFTSGDDLNVIVRNNISGLNVRRIRKEKFPQWSQKDLADQLQLLGHDINKNAVQQLEAGKRFVTDIELKALSQVLCVTIEELLDESSYYPAENAGLEKEIADDIPPYTESK